MRVGAFLSVLVLLTLAVISAPDASAGVRRYRRSCDRDRYEQTYRSGYRSAGTYERYERESDYRPRSTGSYVYTERHTRSTYRSRSRDPYAYYYRDRDDRCDRSTYGHRSERGKRGRITIIIQDGW